LPGFIAEIGEGSNGLARDRFVQRFCVSQPRRGTDEKRPLQTC